MLQQLKLFLRDYRRSLARYAAMATMIVIAGVVLVVGAKHYLWNPVAETVQSATDTVKDATNNTIDAGKRAIDTTVGAAKKAGKAVGDYGKGAWDGTKERVERFKWWKKKPPVVDPPQEER